MLIGLSSPPLPQVSGLGRTRLINVNSFKFPTLITSKRSDSNTLNLMLIRLSSPPLPQVSGLRRTPLTKC